MKSKKTPFGIRTSVLIAIPLALASQSGCKFGNSSKVITSGYDVVSGYYQTEPVSFESEIQFTNASPRVVSHPVTQMPASHFNTMTNPVILMLQSVSSGSAYLVSKDSQSYYIATRVNQDARTLGLSDTQSLLHSGCELKLNLIDSGSFTVGQPVTVGDIQVRGRLNLIRTFEVSYSGAEAGCQELRDIYSTCLTTPSSCLNEVHRENAEILYGTFLSSGLIDLSEVRQATSLRHTAKHE